MKKLLFLFLLGAVMAALLTGCSKTLDQLNQNENKPAAVPPGLLLNGILFNVYDAPDGDYEKWSQYFLRNYDYYGNNRYDFGAGKDFYNDLKNAGKMVDEAQKLGLDPVNPYDAMSKFLKAYMFTRMSLNMGDIPMTQALLGATNLTPVYDSQKSVFLQAFSWLDSANIELGALVADGKVAMQGDIYFDNDLFKWQKVVNTYRLRLLIHLSKQSADGDLKLGQQFAAIMGDPAKYPVMESSDDNLQFNYIFPTNEYPQNPGSFGFDALRENTSATYVGLLTQFKDPRVYITAEPASALVAAGKSPTSFDAFVGADPGEDLGIMYVKANAGDYSLINRKKFYDTYTGEPSIQIGFPEMCFNIAEAINRGWITTGHLGDAEAYYKAGVLASMASYSIPLVPGNMNVYFLHPGASLGTYDTYTVPVDLGAYYNQSLVKYAGNNATGLTQILQQKYLALFRHSGLEAYYNNRRTGVPTFTTGPGTGNSGRIALRFQYPANEKTANLANYTTALQSQYGGTDDINGVMWLLK